MMMLWVLPVVKLLTGSYTGTDVWMCKADIKTKLKGSKISACVEEWEGIAGFPPFINTKKNYFILRLKMACYWKI